MKIEPVNWSSIGVLPSKSYICGNCGKSLVSEKGYVAISVAKGSKVAYIYMPLLFSAHIF